MRNIMSDNTCDAPEHLAEEMLDITYPTWNWSNPSLAWARNQGSFYIPSDLTLEGTENINLSRIYLDSYIPPQESDFEAYLPAPLECVTTPVTPPNIPDWEYPVFEPKDPIYNGPTVDEILTALQGLVDASMLDPELSSRIGNLEQELSAIDKNVLARIDQDGLILKALTEFRESVGEIDSRIHTIEITNQTDRDSLAAQIDIILAKFRNNLATFQQEVTSFASQYSTYVQNVETLQTYLDSQNRLVSAQQKIIVDNSFGTLSQVFNINNRTDLINHLTDENINLYKHSGYQSLNDFQNVPLPDGLTVTEDNFPTVLTIEPISNGVHNDPINSNSVQLNDLIDIAYGQMTFKIDTNGHVAGFGLRASENWSEFIVNANMFAIGPPESGTPITDENGNNIPRANPFIVYQDPITNENTIGMNADVFIKRGQLKTAMIENEIKSLDFNSGNKGWRIRQQPMLQPTGNNVFNPAAYQAEFNNAYIRGTLAADRIIADEIIETGHIKDEAVTIIRVNTQIDPVIIQPFDINPDGSIEGTSQDPLVSARMDWGDLPPAYVLVNGSYFAWGDKGSRDCIAQLRLVVEFGDGGPENKHIAEWDWYGRFGSFLKKEWPGTVVGTWAIKIPRDYTWGNFNLMPSTNAIPSSGGNRTVSEGLISLTGARK